MESGAISTHPDISTDLACGGSDAVVHAADSCGGRLGGEKADVVARSQLTQGQENTIYNGETSDIAWLREVVVAACHAEANNGLESYA